MKGIVSFELTSHAATFHDFPFFFGNQAWLAEQSAIYYWLGDFPIFERTLERCDSRFTNIIQSKESVCQEHWYHGDVLCKALFELSSSTVACSNYVFQAGTRFMPSTDTVLVPTARYSFLGHSLLLMDKYVHVWEAMPCFHCVLLTYLSLQEAACSKHDYANSIRQVPFPSRTSRYVGYLFCEMCRSFLQDAPLLQKKKMPKTGGSGLQRRDALPFATWIIVPKRGMSGMSSQNMAMH